MSDLAGKTAVITGAAQGLGRAIALAYAQAGMRLALLDVQADKLKQLAQELNTDCLTVAADLSQAADTQAAIDTVLREMGTPHILIHNAALLITRSMQQIQLADWQKEVNIILQAAFILSKAVWQPMIDAGGGRIVYLSSGSGIRGFVEEVAYCPAKHGQEGLMKVLAMEGQPFNIAVNTVTPGAPINTPMSAMNYTDDLKQQWVDPMALTPAFLHLARQPLGGLSGERLNAWELSQQVGG
ncbi:MAG TPA: SDR family oxidoreductase [Aggregatilineales bacterium]|nr:SDR family oxidoreductase [Aggregatilineales bacterium]